MNVFGTELIWAWPWAVAILPLPWIARRLLPATAPAPTAALRVPDLSRFAIPEDARESHASWVGAALLIAMWCALVIALARPQGYGAPLVEPALGRDLMLAIDISNSMREEDLYAGDRRVTRIAVVREVARDFVERRTGDRIGLVMFGSQAYVQTPLTADHETVQHFLSEATVGLAGRDTAIGDAIGLATKRLRDAQGDSRVLILLTDGENSAGVVEPLEAARVAARSGIRIHTIGVGAEPARGFAGVRRAALDERSLRAISEATGGRFFRARSARELEAIYAVIDEIEPTEIEGAQLRPLNELQVWPLSMALLLSLLHALWRTRLASWAGAA